MRLGVCAPLEKMDRLAEVGYDYNELGVQSALIPEKDEAEFQQIQAQALSHSIKAEAYAGFLLVTCASLVMRSISSGYPVT